ncbi:hypothetical protein A2229_00220 [Candidatus Peregrinibacteria bacterium RIFOXYA2_FULL_33_7]|nr:MAG: hypothetical protein A2229_00220 [Candidatus Peregrinibacteria bacterium RIFOXYA2_FULL_33_7]
MKFLKTMQVFIAIMTVLSIILILKKWHETTSCVSFNLGFNIYVFFFILSLTISILVYKTKNRFVVYLPLMLILTGFILLFTSYRLQLIQMYEQVVGGAKTWDTFTDEGKPCDLFWVKLIQKN